LSADKVGKCEKLLTACLHLLTLSSDKIGPTDWH